MPAEVVESGWPVCGRGGRVAAWRFWQLDIDDIDDGYENAFWTSIDDAARVLNDVFDLEIDRKERPERPLPSGLVSRSAAARFGFALLAGGIAASIAASFFSVTTSFMRHPPCLLRPPLGLLVHTVAPFVVLRVRG